MPDSYILACDERGTTRLAKDATKTWAFGGFIFEAGQRQKLISTWFDIKLELCGSASCELKWSHFFPGRHQDRGGNANPLKSKNPIEWRSQVKWALTKLFESEHIYLLATYVRKDRASSLAFREAENGRKVLNIETLSVVVFGQFALFLHEQNSTGEIWFDQLGSQKEQDRKQADWIRLRDGDLPINPEHQRMLNRISPVLKFYDSKSEPIIQIADFVLGTIWAASEGDDLFLLQVADNFTPRTYRLASVI